jgi:hypothetical protein
MKLPRSIPLILTIALLVGCKAESNLVIKNASGRAIVVTTGHTGKSIRIPNSRTKTLPHSLGTLAIKQEGGTSWQYSTLDIDDYTSQILRSKKWVFIPVQDLKLSVTPTGTIIVQPPRPVSVEEQNTNVVIVPTQNTSETNSP